MVRPNPSDGSFHIRYRLQERNARAVLYSLKGRRLLSRELKGKRASMRIDRKELPSGVYILRITQEGRPIENKKVMVR